VRRTQYFHLNKKYIFSFYTFFRLLRISAGIGTRDGTGIGAGAGTGISAGCGYLVIEFGAANSRRVIGITANFFEQVAIVQTFLAFGATSWATRPREVFVFISDGIASGVHH